MQRNLIQMLHMEREPVVIYFANTTAVCDMDAALATALPACAVRSFVLWGIEDQDKRMKEYFYPSMVAFYVGR